MLQPCETTECYIKVKTLFLAISENKWIAMSNKNGLNKAYH